MNVKTGEIYEFSTEEFDRLVDKGDWVELNRKPKEGCKRCYGRGYVGRDVLRDR